MKVGVNVAVIDNGQLLLTKREDFEVWCMPGGHVDAGESVAQAALREVREETGLEVRLTRLVGLYSIPEAKAWVNLMILFAAEPIGGVLQPQVSEVLEMRYFAFDEIPHELLWGDRQRILDALSEQGGASVWLQHVPFAPGDVENRRELYALRDASGFERLAFYERYFGWVASEEDRLEVV